MSVQLKLDEMLEIIQIHGEPSTAEFYEQMLNDTANRMASYIYGLGGASFHFGIASMEGVAFGGLCVPFSSLVDGDPMPEILEGYDDEGWE